ncbi:MAG: AI-2E family transporter [Candidatus Dormibacteria bacterium]
MSTASRPSSSKRGAVSAVTPDEAAALEGDQPDKPVEVEQQKANAAATKLTARRGSGPARPDDPDGPAAADAPVTAVPTTTWSWFRAACILVSFFVGYQLLALLGGALDTVLKVVLYVLFGGIIGFIGGPAVDALQRRARMPRGLAIVMVLLSGLAGIGLLVYAVAGAAASEAEQLRAQVPGLIARGQTSLHVLDQQLASRNIKLPHGDILGGREAEISQRVGSFLVTGTLQTFSTLLDILIVLVVAFWLLKDGELLRAGLLNLMPSKIRSNLSFGLDAFGVVIGGYVRAQLFMAFLLGTAAGVGCAILGVPYPIVVAVTAGIFELIPLVGAFVGGGVAILLALTVSPRLALFTLFLFIGLHILEGYVLSPRIQEKFVRLHPLIALLALFAGVEAAGFLGALFAVPAASLGAVFIRAAVGDFRASRPELFAAQSADQYIERRRRRLLGEFRLWKQSPVEKLRRRFGAR